VLHWQLAFDGHCSIFLQLRPSLQPVRHSRLETAVRASSDGPRHGRCVLIEIPVPAGITLRPGAAIALTVCIAGSSITLRIPATGHIHCATCNHKMAGKGAVWRAANAGDAAALEAALAAGGSTEEADAVRRHLEPHLSHTVTLRSVACHRTKLLSVCASRRGHVEAVRILLAAGADVTAKGKVSLRLELPCSTIAASVLWCIATSRGGLSDAPCLQSEAAVCVSQHVSWLSLCGSPSCLPRITAYFPPYPSFPCGLSLRGSPHPQNS